MLFFVKLLFVKGNGIRGRGSLLGPEAKNLTAIVFDTTRVP